MGEKKIFPFRTEPIKGRKDESDKVASPLSVSISLLRVIN